MKPAWTTSPSWTVSFASLERSSDRSWTKWPVAATERPDQPAICQNGVSFSDGPPMNLFDRKSFTAPLLVLGLFVATAATLRYAQDFFLPLVLAGLLSFLLSPLVRRLERWRLGRVGAVLVTAALAFVFIGGLAYLVTSQ